MKHEITGGNLPVVTLYLDSGESIYTQSGGLSWMSNDMSMETNVKGGMMKGLGRMLTGESLFMATYTAQSNNQYIVVASSFPGSILPLELGTGKEYICQKSAFLCAERDVNIAVEVQKGIGRGLFGGEGFLLQRLSGAGMAYLELDGSVKEMDLAPGERIKVQTGNVAVYESTVTYEVETVKGFKNVLFGGEGLFLTTLTGPGKVYLQSITMRDFAAKIIPFIPTQK